MDSNRSAARPFSGRQLEFSNPFMSGEDKKKKREKKEREKKEREEREREDKPYKDSLRVPFRWELTAGKPKLPTTHTSRASTRHVGAGVEEGGRDVPASGLIPSPRRVSSLLRGSRGTARLEEQLQQLPPCSMADGDDDGSFSEMATQAFLVSAVDEQHPRLSPGRLTDPDARGFIMERFLPAAQAMASDADSATFRTPPTELALLRSSPLSLLPPSVASSVRASARLTASSTNGADSANGISSVNFAKCSPNGFSPASGIRSDKGISSGNGIGPDNSTDSVGGISFNKGVGSDKRNIGSVRGLSSADFSNSIDGIGSDKRISSDTRIGSILGISSADFGSSGGGFEDVGVVVPLRLCGFLPPCVERFLCISNRGVRSEKTKKKKKVTKEMKTSKGSHLYRPRSGRLIDMIGEEDDDDWSASEDEDLVARQVRAAMRQRRVLMSHTSSPGSSSVYYDALSQPQTPLFSPFRRVAPQSPFREGKAFLGLPKTPPTCFQTPRASVDVKLPNPALEMNNPQALPLNLAPKTNSPPSSSLPFNPLLNSPPETSNPPSSIPPDPLLNPPLKTNSTRSFPRNPLPKTNNLHSLSPNPPPKTSDPCSLSLNPMPNPPLKINSLQSLTPNSSLKTDSPQSLLPNPPLNLNSLPRINDPPQSLLLNPPLNPPPKTNSPQSLPPKTSSLQSLVLNPPPKISSPRESLPPNPPPKTSSSQPLLPSPALETNSPAPLPPPSPTLKTDSSCSPAPEEASDASNSSGKDTAASSSISRGASRLSSGDEASTTAATNEKCESWPLGIASTVSSSDSPTKSPGRHCQRPAGDKDSPVSVLSPPLPKSPSDSWLWKAIPSIGSYPSPLSAPKMKR